MSMNISGSTPIMSGGLNLAGMDLETALLAVQNERVRLLDQQLNNQLEEVKNRNELMSKLNTLQTALDRAKQAFKADDNPDAKFKDTKINGNKNSAEHRKIVDEINKAFADAGSTERVNINSLTKQTVERHIQKTKSAVDAESNSQQLDMLRLQSMSGKRNEAFDVMTNFVKKMQDSRSSIIGNMR